MTRRGMIIGAGLVCLALFAGGFFFFFSHSSLVAVQPQRGPAVEAVYATGTVEPVQVARIGAKISGRIEQLLVQEGDTVVEGEVLAILDNREASAAVRELEAKLSYAEAEADRYRRLYRSGNTSAAAKEQAESTYRSTQAALEAARARLQEHFLRAAISGDVMRSEQQLDVGDLVSPGQLLFVVGDPARLWVEAEVDEEDIPRVKVGQRALIRADAFSDQPLEGRVRKITPFGDPVARTYRVHIGLPNDTPLLSGMTTEINIIVQQEENALLIPSGAIRDGAVWIVSEGDTVSRREIEEGARGASLTEVRSGLEGGEWLLADPPEDLEEGERVSVTRESR
ncbi:MAG: efflux RND transporter periplasmic adaptor subunit [Parvibaculaceae bacterium]